MDESGGNSDSRLGAIVSRGGAAVTEPGARQTVSVYKLAWLTIAVHVLIAVMAVLLALFGVRASQLQRRHVPVQHPMKGGFGESRR